MLARIMAVALPIIPVIPIIPSLVSAKMVFLVSIVRKKALASKITAEIMPLALEIVMKLTHAHAEMVSLVITVKFQIPVTITFVRTTQAVFGTVPTITILACVDMATKVVTVKYQIHASIINARMEEDAPAIIPTIHTPVFVLETSQVIIASRAVLGSSELIAMKLRTRVPQNLVTATHRVLRL